MKNDITERGLEFERILREDVKDGYGAETVRLLCDEIERLRKRVAELDNALPRPGFDDP